MKEQIERLIIFKDHEIKELLKKAHRDGLSIMEYASTDEIKDKVNKIIKETSDLYSNGLDNLRLFSNGIFKESEVKELLNKTFNLGASTMLYHSEDEIIETVKNVIDNESRLFSLAVDKYLKSMREGH